MISTQWSPALFIQLLLGNTIRIFKMCLRTNSCFPLSNLFFLQSFSPKWIFLTIHIASHSKTYNPSFPSFFILISHTEVLSTLKYTPMCIFFTISITDTLVQANMSLILHLSFHDPFCMILHTAEFCFLFKFNLILSSENLGMMMTNSHI